MDNSQAVLATRQENGLALGSAAAMAVSISKLEMEMQDIVHASKIAAELAKSTIIPEALQGKPANVLIIIMMGKDFGWSAMQSVRFIDVVKGRPTVNAATKVGLCQAHPACEYFRCVEATEKQSTWETKRKGSDVQRYTFTMQDAERRGLAGQHNYKSMPKNMLSARASAALANQAYADVVAGLYSSEELDDPNVRDIGGGQSAAAQKAAWEAFVNEQVTAPPSPASAPPKKADVVVENGAQPTPAEADSGVRELESGTFAEGSPEAAAQTLIQRLKRATSGNEMRAVAKETSALPPDLQEFVQTVYAVEKPRVVALENEKKATGAKA